jgi:NAD(P)-dependent dehydrogenase (short-subunit alcohol dehydrogenase family)
MEFGDFQVVVDVHLFGTVKPVKAVWEIMRTQNYGRIVVTTSSSGLYGNFGQSNYGAAKLGLIGFMNTLKLEGQKNNIHVNAISPVAATRMTENLGMPAEALEQLKPEYVTPGVVFLCSEDAPTGAILTAGAGAFALSRIVETEGVYLGGSATVESVRDNWAKITDETGAKAYLNGGEQSGKFFRKMAGG